MKPLPQKNKTEYNREYYKKNKEKMQNFYKENYKKHKTNRILKSKRYNSMNKDKIRVWNKVAYSNKRLKIELGKCSNCEAKDNLVKHHPDYSKPFEFIVLCKGCHNRLHFSPQTGEKPVNGQAGLRHASAGDNTQPLTFEYEYLETQEEVRKQIQKCEGHHSQQIAYSSFHDCLTQICFGCRKIRSNLRRTP